MRQKFIVTGMTCSACSAHVDKAVRKLAGVSDVNVNLLSGTMTVDWSGGLTADDIVAAVVKSGYGASLPQTGAASGQAAQARPAAAAMEEDLKNMRLRLIWSLVFLIPLFYLSMGHMMGWPIPSFFHGTENAMIYALTLFLLTIPTLIINQKYFRVGFKTLFHLSPNMDSLIAVGSSAAVLYGIVALYFISWGLGHGDLALVERYSMDLYFESAAMIVTLITVGKYLETRSKGKTGQAISRLMDLSPKTATVLRDGQETEIPVEQVMAGDLVLVRPGGSVPVDGVVVEGASSVDESALTGESIPVDKGPGDTVISASINKSGALTLRATRVGENTTLAQMIRLVDEAASSKAPIAKLADKVAGVFVPVVMGIALLTAVIWLLTGHSAEQALTSAVAVLVISCPCALGLANPGGHHGGHREGGGVRHPHQVRRGAGDPARGDYRGAGQDGHRHRRQAQGHRPISSGFHHHGGTAVRGRQPGKALGAPPGRRHRGGGPAPEHPPDSRDELPGRPRQRCSGEDPGREVSGGQRRHAVRRRGGPGPGQDDRRPAGPAGQDPPILCPGRQPHWHHRRGRHGEAHQLGGH